MESSDCTNQSTSQENTNTLGILVAVFTATGLGVLGALLFYRSDTGVNATLWGLSLLASVWFLGRAQMESNAIRLYLALACVALFLFIWRDSMALRLLSVLTLFSIAAVATHSLWGFLLWDTPLVRFISTHLCYGLELALNPLSCLLQSGEIAKEASATHGRAFIGIMRGLVLLGPLLLLYLLLFSSADSAYADAVERLFDLNWENIFIVIMLFGIFSFLALGVLLGSFSQIVDADILTVPQPKEIGILEANTILLGLNFIFVTFVMMQLNHLFGGDDYVRGAVGMGYADYAKNGFFQLVIAAACVIPLLLVLDWLCCNNKGTGRSIFTAATCALLLQVGVIQISAVHRLMLYVDAYGLSTQRVYGLAALLWIAGLLLACGLLLLSQNRHRFVGVAWCWSIFVLFALHALSPDAITMRINLERAAQGKDFDLAYALELGSDSVPVAIERINVLDEGAQNQFFKHWRRELEVGSVGDFRGWTFAEWRAKNSIAAAYETTVGESIEY